MPHSASANEMLHSFFVGNFDDPGAELNPIFGSSENVFQDAANLSSPFIDLERNIALFLGSFLSSGFQIGNGPWGEWPSPWRTLVAKDEQPYWPIVSQLKK